MERGQIDKLLQRYWSGETTLEEEKWLRSNAHLTDEFSEYFSALNQVDNKTPEQPMAIPTSGKLFRLSRRSWMSYAAGVVLFLSLGIILFDKWNRPQPIAMNETYDRPEDARRQTEAALHFVLSKIQRGQSQALKEVKKMESLTLVIPQ